MGLDVAGQNLANINTVGYTRRMLVLGEVPPTDPNNAGRGVEVLAVSAARDTFIEGRLRREQYGAAFEDAIVNGLAMIETSVGAPGEGLDARLAAFFDAFSNLADDVRSVPARDNVVRQGQELASAFNDMATALDNGRRDADLNIRGLVDEVNQLADQVAELNQKIMTAVGDTEALQDERAVRLARLTELTGGAVVVRADGAVDVTAGQGRALVMGETSYDIGITNGTLGHAVLTLGVYDVTGEIAGGTIGGLLHVRDTILPGYTAQLDQLAYDVATQVNTLHAAGFDLNGAAAGDFFAAPGTVAGAASLMAVDSAIAADSALIAGSSTGASGDNQAARALAALRDARFASGGTATATESWSGFVYQIGADVGEARAAAATRSKIVLQLQRLRDEASGVSVDEEAANLMRFQRAYEANARYFTTIVDTLDTLMNLVR
jgi:flagellar hook-associated protein 1 FlgK